MECWILNLFTCLVKDKWLVIIATCIYCFRYSSELFQTNTAKCCSLAHVLLLPPGMTCQAEGRNNAQSGQSSRNSYAVYKQIIISDSASSLAMQFQTISLCLGPYSRAAFKWPPINFRYSWRRTNIAKAFIRGYLIFNWRPQKIIGGQYGFDRNAIVRPG